MSAQHDFFSVRPQGAQAYIDGIWYKEGLHGMIFRWNDEEWVKSTLDVAIFNRAVAGRLHRGQWRRNATCSALDRSTKVVGMKELSGVPLRKVRG